MRVVCLQMDIQLGCPDENFAHAGQMICDAMAEKPDVLVLPEIKRPFLQVTAI